MHRVRDFEHVLIAWMGAQSLESSFLVKDKEISRLDVAQGTTIDRGVAERVDDGGRHIAEEMISDMQLGDTAHSGWDLLCNLR